MPLGMPKGRSKKLKPETLSEIRKHHAVLIGHGFTHGDICQISSRFQSLEVVATKYQDLVAALPELTRGEILNIGRQRSGNLALEVLVKVAADLTEPPLSLKAGQLAGIARQGERPALTAVHSLRHALTSPPLSLTPEQVVALGSNNGGRRALGAVKDQLPVLRAAPYGLSTEQVVTIASAVFHSVWNLKRLFARMTF